MFGASTLPVLQDEVRMFIMCEQGRNTRLPGQGHGNAAAQRINAPLREKRELCHPASSPPLVIPRAA